ncbi:flagellar basal body P-ring formation chaperone FlgA [Dechloromonas sp. TW-R-39-2]|uniref:flagellar basal body P-ring formation chaperone FlgA n=1 Tax=Dechloromonas sp. TW-R-39-2 TaxID=2654218 RepID=UPI001EF0F907|nr:flagellar basal body P-ring formation chaperone FlgA [Dechloromonas sp. TW-R-39-2]
MHNGGMRLIYVFLLPLLIACNLLAAAEIDPVLDTAERHIQIQTKGLPGKVTIRLGKIDTSRLPTCAALEAYTPPGAKMMGKTSVGIRCLTPNAWNILIPAEILVTGNYVTTARSILAGQAIQAGDLHVLSGDVSTLPTGIISDPAAALGKTLRNSLGAGQLLRSDQLISPMVIRQGQSVRVTSKGAGFAVSGEGKAINNAAEGQLVQVRMNSGQTVSGTARSDGSVEISF